MSIESRIVIREQSPADLADYARVPIAFEVRRVLDVAVRDNGLGGFALSERALDVPYVKDYDAFDGGPARWPEHFDLSHWTLLAAFDGGRRVGGAAVLWRAPGVDMLQRRPDRAVLWDLRVAPQARGRGVGRALVRAAATRAAGAGCGHLLIETQNINVPACRLYRSVGGVLGDIHRFAYPDLPEEVQLLWFLPLRPAPVSGARRTQAP